MNQTNNLAIVPDTDIQPGQSKINLLLDASGEGVPLIRIVAGQSTSTVKVIGATSIGSQHDDTLGVVNDASQATNGRAGYFDISGSPELTQDNKDALVVMFRNQGHSGGSLKTGIYDPSLGEPTDDWTWLGANGWSLNNT